MDGRPGWPAFRDVSQVLEVQQGDANSMARTRGSLALALGAAAVIGAALGLLGSTAVIGIQIGTARHFKISPLFGLLFPFAYTAIAALAWRSFMLRRAGRVTWKGRTYALQRKASAGQP